MLSLVVKSFGIIIMFCSFCGYGVIITAARTKGADSLSDYIVAVSEAPILFAIATVMLIVAIVVLYDPRRD